MVLPNPSGGDRVNVSLPPTLSEALSQFSERIINGVCSTGELEAFVRIWATDPDPERAESGQALADVLFSRTNITAINSGILRSSEYPEEKLYRGVPNVREARHHHGRWSRSKRIALYDARRTYPNGPQPGVVGVSLTCMFYGSEDTIFTRDIPGLVMCAATVAAATDDVSVNDLQEHECHEYLVHPVLTYLSELHIETVL